MLDPAVSFRAATAKSGVECFKAGADVSGTPLEIFLNKRNYRQAKRQKEEARKMRQQQKEQRRSGRTTADGVSAITDSAAPDREPATTMQVPES